MKVFIITGASKGLGLSIVKQVMGLDDSFIIGISRNKSVELEKFVSEKVKLFCFDLTNIEEIPDLMNNIVSELNNIKDVQCIYLINNAGILNPIKPLEEINIQEALYNIKLNYLSVFLLTLNFIKYTKNSRIKKYIVNISSKSAENPIKNWSCYGNSKAAVDNFTKYIAIEYGEKSNIKSISFHPPAMNTEMRKENLRAKGILWKIWDFIIVNILREKRVYSSDEVAQKIIDIILNKNYHSGSIVDIN